MAGIDDSRAFMPVRIAVLTVSDTRTLAEDRSGQVLVDRIAEAGHVLAARKHPAATSAPASRAQLRAWCADPGIDVVIFDRRHRADRARRDGRGASRRL